MTRLMRIVSDWPLRIAAFALTLLLVAQVIVVALRYVFAVGWSWALDLLVYSLPIIALLPAIAVLTGNVAIRVDVFYSEWSKPKRRMVDRIALFFLFFPTMSYAAWAMWGSVIRSWQVLESSPTIGGLPGYFILKTILFLYFAGLAVTALILAARKAPYESEEDT